MVYKWFDKKTGGAIKNENVSPKELAEELRKARKKYTLFIDNIWDRSSRCAIDSNCNKGIHFLVCVIDVFSKFAWVNPLKDKRGFTITNASKKFLWWI